MLNPCVILHHKISPRSNTSLPFSSILAAEGGCSVSEIKRNPKLILRIILNNRLTVRALL